MKLWFPSLVGRVLMGSLSPEHIQFVCPPTVQGYQEWIKKQNASSSQQNPPASPISLTPDIEQLGDTGASILWIGDRKQASKVVLFFHGGGYLAPPLPGHFTWCWEAYVKPSLGTRAPAAVAFLQYTLAPGGQYPQQLREASAALNHILQSGIEPRDIMFGGDSAGGNLAVQLSYHILHPNPDVPLVKLAHPVAGVFLVSPWVSDRTDTASFKENETIDILYSGLIQGASHYALRSEDAAPRSAEANPVLAMDGDVTWLRNLDDVTGALYITAGKQEVFRDAIVDFAEAVRGRCPSIGPVVEVPDHEAHDYILLENDAGVDGDATQRMRRWASGRLATEESV
ncbi:hypothetical protein ACJ41O_006188 [Fusarium nematophilum]